MHANSRSLCDAWNGLVIHIVLLHIYNESELIVYQVVDMWNRQALFLFPIYVVLWVRPLF
jgi:hypothetical protein